MKRISISDVPDPVWDGECLRWQGVHHSRGYGMFGRKYVHRWFWELFNGPIPTGLTIDHVYDWGCRHKDCFRLSHMEVVPQSVNTSRNKIARALAARTHCNAGHEYTTETVYFSHGYRCCLLCARERSTPGRDLEIATRVCQKCSGPMQEYLKAGTKYCDSPECSPHRAATRRFQAKKTLTIPVQNRRRKKLTH